ncbi:hypothetical protein [Flaviflexus sp.]|uniref:hypothetical protein n=1 Tax=Flaviflexus sp. TaxID=1969482 RepID=UPI003F902D22
MARDNYGVTIRQTPDFGKPAPGTNTPNIEEFTTAFGVTGTAYTGPRGRFTVLPGDTRDRFAYSVQEAATVRRIRTCRTFEEADLAARRAAGIHSEN